MGFQPGGATETADRVFMLKNKYNDQFKLGKQGTEHRFKSQETGKIHRSYMVQEGTNLPTEDHIDDIATLKVNSKEA